MPEAAVLMVLILGMWGFSWMDTDDFEPEALLSLILPVILSASAFATAWGVGSMAPSSAKTVVLIADSVMLAASIAAAAVFSIKEYREEGCEPNYAAFGIVAGYSIILTVVSVLFTYLS